MQASLIHAMRLLHHVVITNRIYTVVYKGAQTNMVTHTILRVTMVL